MEFNINLSKETIIEEIRNNYLDDADFIFDIINNCTMKWDTIKDIREKITKLLEENNEL